MKFISATVFTFVFAVSIFAQKQAEVIVASTHLRKSPDVSAEKIATLQKGDTVVFEKSRDNANWFFVSTAGGTLKGWIRKDTISEAKKALPASEKSKPKSAEQQTEKPTTKPTEKTTPIAQPTIPTPNETAKTTAENTDSTVPAEPINIEDNEVLRIDTEEVSLNVRVVDSGFRPVKNLNQTDFKIYEDGVLQPVTSVTTAEVPIINALVIDNSRSLREQLGKIIEAGKIIVNTNRDTDQTSVVRFVSNDKIEIVQEFTPNKNSLINALENLYVEGGQTAVIDAIFRTAKMVNDYQNSQKREDVKLRSLIVVSDGDDRGSALPESQLFKLLRETNVQIYAIGFTKKLTKDADSDAKKRQEKAKDFLTKLAQETGGKVYFPESIEELPSIATEISGELRTQYLLSYVPTNENRNGSFRKIKVEVGEGKNKEKRTAITRTGRNSQSP